MLKKYVTTKFKEMFDLMLPRTCAACGQRLSVGENVLCGMCNFDLPRTRQYLKPLDNELAKLFWIQIPIEKAAALFFYKSHTQTSKIIYKLKYFNRPDVGVAMGRMAAAEFAQNNFFEGIDCIVPVPLTSSRKRERGYNQSEMIARGINHITSIPLFTDAVKRVEFKESQTRKDRWDRMDNVDGVFQCVKSDKIKGCHVLVVDDVITTGATIVGCATALVSGGASKISVMSLGYAKP